MDGSDRRYSTVRAAGREHFPESPRGFIAIRIVQLILAVACLGTDAYVLSNVLFDGVELTMFVVSLLFRRRSWSNLFFLKKKEREMVKGDGDRSISKSNLANLSS